MRQRSRVFFLAVVVLGASLGIVFAQAGRKSPIPFPNGYRKWTHVRSMVIFSKDHALYERFGGLHDVYVNDIGVSSLQQGKVYPDGTVFVFDLFDIRTAQGAIEARNRKFVGVMKKNSKLYADTGGWGFEVFAGDQTKGSLQDAKACFDCHAARKRSDYVYSAYTP